MTHFQIQALLFNGVSTQQIQQAAMLEEQLKANMRVGRQVRMATEQMDDFEMLVRDMQRQLDPINRVL